MHDPVAADHAGPVRCSCRQPRDLIPRVGKQHPCTASVPAPFRVACGEAGIPVSRTKPSLKERRPTVDAVIVAIDQSGASRPPSLLPSVEAACSPDVAADTIALRQLRDEIELERGRMLDRAAAHEHIAALREILLRLHVRNTPDPEDLLGGMLAAARRRNERLMDAAGCPRPPPRRLASIERPADAAPVDALLAALDAAAAVIPFESVTEQAVDLEIAERAVRADGADVSTDDAGRALGKSASWLRKARASARAPAGATGRPKT